VGTLSCGGRGARSGERGRRKAGHALKKGVRDDHADGLFQVISLGLRWVAGESVKGGRWLAVRGKRRSAELDCRC